MGGEEDGEEEVMLNVPNEMCGSECLASEDGRSQVSLQTGGPDLIELELGVGLKAFRSTQRDGDAALCGADCPVRIELK